MKPEEINDKQAGIAELNRKLSEMQKMSLYLNYNLYSSALFIITFIFGPFLIPFYYAAIFYFLPKLMKTFKSVGWTKQLNFIRYCLLLPVIILFLAGIIFKLIWWISITAPLPFFLYFVYLRIKVAEWIREQIFIKQSLEQNLEAEFRSFLLLQALNKEEIQL